MVAFVGLARATRTPPGSVLPSFALVLVLAMVAFPDMIAASVTQAQVAASWQQVAADAIIAVPATDEISPALQRQISAMPGIAATATATATGSLSSGFAVSVMWVDPARSCGRGRRGARRAVPGGRAVRERGDTPPRSRHPGRRPVAGTAPAEVECGVQHHHDRAGRTDRQRPRPARARWPT